MSQLKLVKIVLSAAMATFFAANATAVAGTATTNLGVTASVTGNCIISTADVAFGAYDPIVANAASAQNGTGTVTITCTKDESTVLTLGLGANDNGGSASDPARRLRDGTNFLSYTLFSNAGRTTEWGNNAGTGVADTGTGTARAHTVYGSIGSGQNVPEGSYSDTVLATVTF